MTDTLNVHIASGVSEANLARIQAVSPRLRLTFDPHIPYRPAVGMEKWVGDIEVLVTYHMAFDLQAAPRLRWVQLSSGGVNHLRGHPLLKSNILVTNSRVFGAPITEYVFASILSFNRRFPQMWERFQKGREWPANQWEVYAGTEVEGQTMAILGYGSIGRKLARVAQAFEMKVIATRRHLDQAIEENGVTIYPAHALREVMAQGDVVVNCLPLTDETEGLIGEAELRAMKPTAYMVNVGRGKIIDDAALLRALREGWIAGAGLDVHAQTPLPPDSPYFDLPNVILTPHMSGVSQGNAERFIQLVCENLRRYLAGEPLLYVVDKQGGY